MQQQIITNKKIERRKYKSIEEFEDDYFSVRPSVRRRWGRISKEMDQGKGIRFKSAEEFFQHLGNF